MIVPGLNRFGYFTVGLKHPGAQSSRKQLTTSKARRHNIEKLLAASGSQRGGNGKRLSAPPERRNRRLLLLACQRLRLRPHELGARRLFFSDVGHVAGPFPPK